MGCVWPVADEELPAGYADGQVASATIGAQLGLLLEVASDVEHADCAGTHRNLGSSRRTAYGCAM
jgi:hypothetical protein